MKVLIISRENLDAEAQEQILDLTDEQLDHLTVYPEGDTILLVLIKEHMVEIHLKAGYTVKPHDYDPGKYYLDIVRW